jgi:hypothetical protein
MTLPEFSYGPQGLRVASKMVTLPSLSDAELADLMNQQPGQVFLLRHPAPQPRDDLADALAYMLAPKPHQRSDEVAAWIDAGYKALMTAPRDEHSHIAVEIKTAKHGVMASDMLGLRSAAMDTFRAALPPEPATIRPPNVKPALHGFDITASGDHRPGLWRTFD